MKIYKIQALVVLAVSLFSAPLLANAEDLKFANDTNVDLSVVVNHSCSKEFGVIKQHTEKTISEKELQKACKFTQSNCTMQVYNMPNCNGNSIETVVLDTKKGVISLEGGDNGQGSHYFWKANGFYLYVSNH